MIHTANTSQPNTSAVNSSSNHYFLQFLQKTFNTLLRLANRIKDFILSSWHFLTSWSQKKNSTPIQNKSITSHHVEKRKTTTPTSPAPQMPSFLISDDPTTKYRKKRQPEKTPVASPLATSPALTSAVPSDEGVKSIISSTSVVEQILQMATGETTQISSIEFLSILETLIGIEKSDVPTQGDVLNIEHLLPVSQQENGSIVEIKKLTDDSISFEVPLDPKAPQFAQFQIRNIPQLLNSINAPWMSRARPFISLLGKDTYIQLTTVDQNATAWTGTLGLNTAQNLVQEINFAPSLILRRELKVGFGFLSTTYKYEATVRGLRRTDHLIQMIGEHSFGSLLKNESFTPGPKSKLHLAIEHIYFEKKF